MKALLFLVYIALGAGAGWAAYTFGGFDLNLSVIGGVILALALGQVHLFIASGRDTELEERIHEVGSAQESSSRRLSVLEARTDVVETTVKHELTERRDALVSEMKQLEGLIERLSANFETRLNGKSDSNGLSNLSNVRPSPAHTPTDPALKDVREALDKSRVDLHLQPIVSLPQRRVAFYEGMTRLRREDGSLIQPAEFLDAARRARLLGIIETLTLFRCVEIVRRLHQKDRRVGVFCNVSASSLDDDQFFPFFLEFISDHRDLSGAVIFEMAADRFEQRSRKIRENMDKLASLGFRFSLDQTASLAIDLPRLQDAGVRFVKIGGGTLIDQLRDPNGPRPASSIMAQISGEDVSAVFSRYGVTMVADRLDDEASVVEVLEYGIPYGQGHVFGSPRPIKASLMEETAPPSEFRRRISTFG